MSPRDEFEALMAQYERNSNIGSLKSANVTLARLLRLVWAQLEAGANDPAAKEVAADIAHFKSKVSGLTLEQGGTEASEGQYKAAGNPPSEPPIEASKMPDEPMVDAPPAVIEEPSMEEPSEAPQEASSNESDDAPKARRGRGRA